MAMTHDQFIIMHRNFIKMEIKSNIVVNYMISNAKENKAKSNAHFILQKMRDVHGIQQRSWTGNWQHTNQKTRRMRRREKRTADSMFFFAMLEHCCCTVALLLLFIIGSCVEQQSDKRREKCVAKNIAPRESEEK